MNFILFIFWFCTTLFIFFYRKLSIHLITCNQLTWMAFRFLKNITNVRRQWTSFFSTMHLTIWPAYTACSEWRKVMPYWSVSGEVASRAFVAWHRSPLSVKSSRSNWVVDTTNSRSVRTSRCFTISLASRTDESSSFSPTSTLSKTVSWIFIIY